MYMNVSFFTCDFASVVPINIPLNTHTHLQFTNRKDCIKFNSVNFETKPTKRGESISLYEFILNFRVTLWR